MDIKEVLAGCNNAGAKGVMEGLMTPYVKVGSQASELKSNPMLAGYQMGKVSDKETEKGGKKKKVKHISITGGTSGGMVTNG